MPGPKALHGISREEINMEFFYDKTDLIFPRRLVSMNQGILMRDCTISQIPGVSPPEIMIDPILPFLVYNPLKEKGILILRKEIPPPFKSIGGSFQQNFLRIIIFVFLRKEKGIRIIALYGELYRYGI